LRLSLKIIVSVAVLLSAVCFTAQQSFATCHGRFLNPITDVCWQCIFPVKIGGISLGDSSGLKNPPDQANTPICFCPAPPPVFFRMGISLSFWEPARFEETVKDPFCFPSLGFGLSNFLSGGYGSKHEIANRDDTGTFAQVHYFIFPAWAMLELLTDFSCIESSGFDVAYMTEVDPLWNDDNLAFIIEPESLLFANPIAQLACVADSVSSNIGLPLTPLFWCMGSLGSAYPLTGHVDDSNYVQAQAAEASRMIYKLGREGLLWDTGLNLCGAVPTPIWVKWNYRLQIARPVRGSSCFPIGRTSMIWGSGKNPAFSSMQDNFLFMIFRKRVCCAF
jgi:conjugal transfer pilus assembly protein TraU